MRNQLVVVEGGDAVGKKTQTGLLVEALQERGLSVAQISFPRYETFFGQLVRESLDGQLGDFRNLHPKLASLPYILDRIAARDEILEARSTHDFVICNRYVESNAVYGMSKLSNADEELAFMSWLFDAEYVHLGFISQPDRVILLDSVPAASGGLVHSRGEKLDQYEADKDYQRRVTWTYKTVAETNPRLWKVVKCNDGNSLRTPQAIHEDVLAAVLA